MALPYAKKIAAPLVTGALSGLASTGVTKAMGGRIFPRYRRGHNVGGTVWTPPKKKKIDKLSYLVKSEALSKLLPYKDAFTPSQLRSIKKSQ